MHISVDADSAGNLKLEMVYANETKRKIYPKGIGKVIKLGRNQTNDIVLDNFAYSRIHCSFFYSKEDESWYVQDGFEGKFSTNGTWLYLDWSWPIENNLSFRIANHNLCLNII